MSRPFSTIQKCASLSNRWTDLDISECLPWKQVSQMQSHSSTSDVVLHYLDSVEVKEHLELLEDVNAYLQRTLKPEASRLPLVLGLGPRPILTPPNANAGLNLSTKEHSGLAELETATEAAEATIWSTEIQSDFLLNTIEESLLKKLPSSEMSSQNESFKTDWIDEELFQAVLTVESLMGSHEKPSLLKVQNESKLDSDSDSPLLMIRKKHNSIQPLTILDSSPQIRSNRKRITRSESIFSSSPQSIASSSPSDSEPKYQHIRKRKAATELDAEAENISSPFNVRHYLDLEADCKADALPSQLYDTSQASMGSLVDFVMSDNASLILDSGSQEGSKWDSLGSDRSQQQKVDMMRFYRNSVLTQADPIFRTKRNQFAEHQGKFRLKFLPKPNSSASQLSEAEEVFSGSEIFVTGEDESSAIETESESEAQTEAEADFISETEAETKSIFTIDSSSTSRKSSVQACIDEQQPPLELLLSELSSSFWSDGEY